MQKTDYSLFVILLNTIIIIIIIVVVTLNMTVFITTDPLYRQACACYSI
jgi:hypothetical protein